MRPGLASTRTLSDWREDLRAALSDAGHTQLSFAVALGWQREHVTRLFRPETRRGLSADVLERMRELAPDVYEAFQRRQCARAGLVVVRERRRA